MTAKKVSPKVEPTKDEKMSGYAKKAHKALIKKYGKNHMSDIAKSGWKKRKAAARKAELAAKKAAKK